MQTKTIGAFEARRQFGKLLSAAGFSGTSIVVEKNGQRIAAIVPVKVLDDWEKERQAFFDEMRRMAETANLPEEEATSLANKAVADVRNEKRTQQQPTPAHS
jgi:prevent-host-death family protein